MITSFFISIPAYILGAIISIMPQGGSVPTEWVQAVSQIWTAINAFSFIVPVSSLLSCLGIVLGFELAVFGFYAFNWVLKKVPGMN